MKEFKFNELNRRVINRDQIAKELGDRFFGSLREICSKYPVEHHVLLYESKRHTFYRLEFVLHGKVIAKFLLDIYYRPTVDTTYYDTYKRILARVYQNKEK